MLYSFRNCLKLYFGPTGTGEGYFQGGGGGSGGGGGVTGILRKGYKRFDIFPKAS